MSGVSHEIETLFRAGAAQASRALAAWLDRPASLVVERLESLPLADAVAVLGRGDEPICGAGMQVAGGLGGVILLTAPDAVGLILADLVLGRSPGTSRAWHDLERSAVMETANIVGCRYLNPLATGLGVEDAGALIPSPPCFVRDFPATVMQAALSMQTAESDSVLLATTEFSIDGVPTRCGLVFVPDAAALGRLAAAGGRGRPA